MNFIFSYNREGMLRQVVDALAPRPVTILDDGSDFRWDSATFLRLKHGGKRTFWEKWLVALKLAEGSDDDLFVFLQDDCLNPDIERIEEIHAELGVRPYVHHIINDGREWCWDRRKLIRRDASTYRAFFVDCIFFCNRLALEKIGFTMNPVPANWFTRPDISSGVGAQLTARFNKAAVMIVKPIKSLAYHGNHESLMHAALRSKQPLVSL